MSELLSDLRYALRTLRRSPGFTLAAVLTLALGIGATTAVFTVLNGVLLRPLPYRAPAELVRVYDINQENGITHGAFSPQDFADLEADSVAFAGMGAYLYGPGQIGIDLAGSGEPTRLTDALVSADFFRTMGVAPMLGRVPSRDEYRTGADRVAVLSDGLWRRQFGADLSVVGRKITLGGEPFTVVGVMPAAFVFPGPDVDLWLPLSLVTDDQIPHRRDVRWLSVVARLARGSTPAAAQRRASEIIAGLATSFPEADRGWTAARVIPLQNAITGDVRPALQALFAAVTLVLFIACANIASLLLARTSGRSQEVAIRSALGASRGRLARQFLVESVVLATLGGAAGFVLAWWGVRVLIALGGGMIPRAESIAPGATVLGFALLATAACALLFGAVPAWRAAGSGAARLGETGRGSSPGRQRSRLRGGLVVAETALAMLLLAGAGLMVRSLWHLTHIDPGLRAEHVLTLSISVSSARHPSAEDRAAFRNAVLERLAALPGVIAAGGSKTLPLQGGGEQYGFNLPGRPSRDHAAAPMIETYIVTTGYFRALGIPVLQGRVFTAADRPAGEGGTPGVVVNQTFAQSRWPGEDAVGKTLQLGDASIPVLGIVGDVRNHGLADAPREAVYVPITFFSRSHLALFLRTAGNPLALVNSARRAIWSLDPDQAITDITTVDELVSSSVAQPRFFTVLVTLFGGLALLLSAVGLYGLLAFTVQQRTRELGIRVALGAGRGEVLAMVLRQSLGLTGAGLALGALGALLLTRFLASQLYGVAPGDPTTLTAAGLTLALVAIAASVIPARRATRIDPVIALREE